MLAGIIIAAIVIVLAIGAVVMYNALIRAKVAVEEGWSQIDVQLTRRADLIPNLVSTVKGAAEFERGTLNDVTAARAALSSAANPASAAAADGALTAALGRLFAVAEAYPALTATANFRDLQEQLAETENKVAFARQYYNDMVRELNTKIATFPWMLMAGIAGATRAEFFDAPEGAQHVPTVEF